MKRCYLKFVQDQLYFYDQMESDDHFHFIRRPSSSAAFGNAQQQLTMFFPQDVTMVPVKYNHRLFISLLTLYLKNNQERSMHRLMTLKLSMHRKLLNSQISNIYHTTANILIWIHIETLYGSKEKYKTDNIKKIVRQIIHSLTNILKVPDVSLTL